MAHVCGWVAEGRLQSAVHLPVAHEYQPLWFRVLEYQAQQQCGAVVNHVVNLVRLWEDLPMVGQCLLIPNYPFC